MPAAARSTSVLLKRPVGLDDTNSASHRGRRRRRRAPTNDRRRVS